MHIAYWHKKGLDIYRLKNNRPEKAASGLPAELKPFKAFGKKVLVVGREVLLHARQRYPAMDERDIRKAVANNIDELFPLQNPLFFLQVFESSKMYVLVDVWAWDASAAERIKGIFSFTHVIPEDLALVSGMSGMLAYGLDDAVNLLACADGRFLGSSTFAAPLKQEDAVVFIKSLGRESSGIKTLRLYGLPSAGFEMPGIAAIKEKQKDYPIFLDNISGLKLNDFRTRDAGHYLPGLSLVPRLAVYLLLGYSLSLYFSAGNYETALRGIDEKILLLSKKADVSAKAIKGSESSELLAGIEEKMKGRVSPLYVMNLFAENLPEKSFLTRMVINERKIEANVSSPDPVRVIRALSRLKEFRNLRIKGSIIKSLPLGNYNFVMEVEI